MNAFHRLHALRMDNDAARYRMDEMRPRFERLASRHENGSAPRAVVAFNLFQTPPELAARLVETLPVGVQARVLEPSAGLGRLLDALSIYMVREVVAVELAAQCAAELYRQARPRVTLKQGDFLQMEPGALGEFDCVAMNPPFHMRADIKHILHALRFLKVGGKLAALCLDTPHRVRALKPLADTWEQIPAGAFKSEGTGVACVLLTITKK